MGRDPMQVGSIIFTIGIDLVRSVWPLLVICVASLMAGCWMGLRLASWAMAVASYLIRVLTPVITAVLLAVAALYVVTTTMIAL
jgi:hypothetical protein